MLDNQLIEQLRSVFQKLENKVELVLYYSTHEKQEELKTMLTQVSSTSDNIELIEIPEEKAYPEFYLKYNGKKSGVSFMGTPGGHEFTSLILAILNIDNKGKLPDLSVLKRIANLKGPIKLKTFISLTCENCPEVVQALNIMAMTNSDFEHQMVNGEIVQEEIERLNVQGVPSVFHADNLVLSGRNSLLELVEKLEKHFGTKGEVENTDLGLFDVVVIGGGPAGVSAAIYTSRKGFKTAVVASKIGGQVQETKGIENLISTPYIEGPELSSRLELHMKDYPVQVFEHRFVDAIDNNDIKTIKLNSGESIQAKSIIVATGAKWRHLNISGEKEYIGRGVAFCAHCDGPYYKGKEIAVVGGGNSGVEAAIDLAGIVKSVKLIEYNDTLKADKVLVDKLKSLPNVEIITNAKTSQIIGNGSAVTQLEFEDKISKEIKSITLDGVFVQIGLIPNSDFIKNIVETNRFGEIIVDHKCHTSAEGIYAAGDVTNVPYKQIVVSMGEGAKAALTCSERLMMKS